MTPQLTHQPSKQTNKQATTQQSNQETSSLAWANLVILDDPIEVTLLWSFHNIMKTLPGHGILVARHMKTASIQKTTRNTILPNLD